MIFYGCDFLKDDYSKEYFDMVVMNPPFKLFDSFVEKSKQIADKVVCIGKLNFFSSHGRNVNKIWEHLEWVLPFDRQITYDRPTRSDGKVECGMMITGWFIWNKYYNAYPKIKVLDMQKHIAKRVVEMKDCFIEVGEVFNLGNKKIKCVEGLEELCTNCVFLENSLLCENYPCVNSERKDGKNVYFKDFSKDSLLEKLLKEIYEKAEQKNLTLEDLSVKTSIDKNRLASIFYDEKLITIDEFLLLAEAVGCKPDFFLEEKNLRFQ